MLDDLRNSATYQDDEPLFSDEPVQVEPVKAPFMGMTAPQRLVVALLLFFMVCVLGSFCLILTERIIPPIY